MLSFITNKTILCKHPISKTLSQFKNIYLSIFCMENGDNFTVSYHNGIISSMKDHGRLYTRDKDDHVPRPVVFCGPSGSGKSTLLKLLMKEFKEYFDFSISHTTRSPRPGEINGKDYHFVSRAEMKAAIENNEFLEFAEFSGNLYGTSKKTVKKIQNCGKICILDVEINGVKNIKKTPLNPKFVFVKPPTVEILEQRLRHRNTETEESLQKRLHRAKVELEYGEIPGNFDLVIVNDDIDEAYRQLREFLLPDIEEVKKMHLS